VKFLYAFCTLSKFGFRTATIAAFVDCTLIFRAESLAQTLGAAALQIQNYDGTYNDHHNRRKDCNLHWG
jgi:L-ribulose-5-phosphate 3-epimerase UlaE